VSKRNEWPATAPGEIFSPVWTGTGPETITISNLPADIERADPVIASGGVGNSDICDSLTTAAQVLWRPHFHFREYTIAECKLPP
jgi:imidazole glycerol phosphate synthase subunit HisF